MDALEDIFEAHYDRIARTIARLIHDPAQAEELAVEVFLKWSRTPSAHGDQAPGWLSRTAIHLALDQLRRQTRRQRYERLLHLFTPAPTPEQLHVAQQQSNRVRQVLAVIAPRHAELLVLRSEDLSYDEIATALHLNPASVGKLLSRAQDAFRKEYLKRHGQS